MGEKSRENPGFSQELEEYRQIKDVIGEYSIIPYTLRRDGDSWVSETDAGSIRIEKFRHSLPEFFFVLSAMGFLRDRGLDSLPKLFNNRKGQPVTEHQSGLFCVLENPPGKMIDVREIDALTGITRHLAELHRTSVGYTPPPLVADVRQDWGDWEEKWQYRLDELYRLGEEAQHHKGDFEHLYLKVLDDFIQDGVEGLEQLKNLNIRSVVEEERLRGGLCQRDYKPANLLERKEGYWLLDFDDFAGQSHLEDIARFIKEVGDWDPDRIRYILDVYSQVYVLSDAEREAVMAYLKLPLDLWKVARNHYLRGKPQKHNLKAVIQEMTRRKRCFSQMENPRHSTMPVGHLPWVWGLPAENPPNASLEQYWGQWNWGQNWQAAPQTIMNVDDSGWQWGAYPAMEPAQVQAIAEPVTNMEEAIPETPFEAESISTQVEAPVPDAVEDGLVGEGFSEEFPAQAEAEQPVPFEPAAIADEPEPVVEVLPIPVQETPSVTEKPKVVVWKAFPKPLA